MTQHSEDPVPPRDSRPSLNDDAAPEQGDLVEFEALFHTQYGALCEYLRHMVRSRDVAEELAQDTFVRLWERHTRAPVSLAVPYLYAAARNRALTYLRREELARIASGELARDAAAPRDETVTAEVHCNHLAAAAERAIAELPERCRLVFVMSRREGLSYAEIANALGITVSTVENQISRALKHMRARLSPFLALSLALQPALEITRRLIA